MKNFGKFCIGLGGLSLLGALMAGHSITGPTVWLALGITLVLFAKQKEDDKQKEMNQEETGSKAVANNTDLQQNIINKHPNNPARETACNIYERQDESASTISAQQDDAPLTQEQKEAAICLISFFAGYNDDVETNETIYQLSHQVAQYLEITNYPEMLPDAMNKNQDPNKMIDRIMTIKDRKSKECMLLVCYDFAKMSGKPEAFDLLFNIAGEMGYFPERFKSLIKQYTR